MIFSGTYLTVIEINIYLSNFPFLPCITLSFQVLNLLILTLYSEVKLWIGTVQYVFCTEMKVD